MKSFRLWASVCLLLFCSPLLAQTSGGALVRATGGKIIFRRACDDSSGNPISSGTTTLYLYEQQDDGTLKSFDWNDNTFKSTALTTETVTMTHRVGNNSTTNTGIWTYSLATVSGFTAGKVYYAVSVNSSASPARDREVFVYGGADGDLSVSSGAVKIQSGTGTGQINLSGGNLAGSVGSVTGAVGSVTGNISGNVLGTVAQIATGGITSASFSSGAIDATAFAQAAADKIWASSSRSLTASVTVDLTQALTGTGGWTGITIMDCLKSSWLYRSKQTYASGTLTYYAPDNTTAFKTFSLSPAPSTATTRQ